LSKSNLAAFLDPQHRVAQTNPICAGGLTTRVTHKAKNPLQDHQLGCVQRRVQGQRIADDLAGQRHAAVSLPRCKNLYLPSCKKILF
jgi:hypothetical protein